MILWEADWQVRPGRKLRVLRQASKEPKLYRPQRSSDPSAITSYGIFWPIIFTHFVSLGLSIFGDVLCFQKCPSVVFLYHYCCCCFLYLFWSRSASGQRCCWCTAALLLWLNICHWQPLWPRLLCSKQSCTLHPQNRELNCSGHQPPTVCLGRWAMALCAMTGWAAVEAIGQKLLLLKNKYIYKHSKLNKVEQK